MSEIKRLTNFISSSFIPQVVAGGVPILIPDVMNGDRGSKGIAFLFRVIPTLSYNIPASLPVSSPSTLLVSTKTRWFLVPPLTTRKPSPINESDNACAFFRICFA